MARKDSWSPAEDKIIRDTWAEGADGAVLRAVPQLPKRTESAIRQQAHKLGCSLRGNSVMPSSTSALREVSHAELHAKTERFMRDDKPRFIGGLDLGQREYMRVRAINLIEEIASIFGKPVSGVAEAFVAQATDNFAQDARLRMSVAIDGPVTMDGVALR